MKGLEPSLPRGNWNLNPARLPISPHPQKQAGRAVESRPVRIIAYRPCPVPQTETSIPIARNIAALAASAVFAAAASGAYAT
jgi:hypothetical protein